MKITQEDIELVKAELLAKRKELDELNFPTLEKKLDWIEKFFNQYIPELEKRYMTEAELKQWIFLPDELRLQFYLIFPEHGLNMANYSQELVCQLNRRIRRGDFVSRVGLGHYD